jgi:hypothetical protein
VFSSDLAKDKSFGGLVGSLKPLIGTPYSSKIYGLMGDRIVDSFKSKVPYIPTFMDQGKEFRESFTPNPYNILSNVLTLRPYEIEEMKATRDKNLEDTLGTIRQVAVFNKAIKDERLQGVDKDFLLGVYKNVSNAAPGIVNNEGLLTNLLVNASTFGTKDIDPSAYKTFSEIAQNLSKAKSLYNKSTEKEGPILKSVFEQPRVKFEKKPKNEKEK